VPAAIHLSPEALPDGPLARLRDGDVVRLCGHAGQIEAVGIDLSTRDPAPAPPAPIGTGRELFAVMRAYADPPEAGASAMLSLMDAEAPADEFSTIDNP
jgi:phosphogluconate dehydratase